MQRQTIFKEIKSIFIIGMIVSSYSTIAFATQTVVAYNEANITANQYWNVRVYTNTDEWGTIVGRWDFPKWGMRLPIDDSIKVTKIKFCIGELYDCMAEENFKPCPMQESGIDINVDVHLLPGNQCYAVRNAG